MNRPPQLPASTFDLLIEGPSGVAEYRLSVVRHNGNPTVRPVAARVLSGEAPKFSASDLDAAFGLQNWAATHPEIFLEGRVVHEL